VLEWAGPRRYHGARMRLAILSDIHGNLAALKAVAADLAARGVDEVVNLGDSLSGPLLPLETAHFLMAQGWTHLAGNHERQLLTLEPAARGPSDAYAHSQLTHAELAWLETLHPTARLGPEILLCHGTPGSDVEPFLDTVEPGGTVRPASRAEVAWRLGGERATLVACGHTHLPHCVRGPQGELLVNPGSVGLPAYEDQHPWPHVVETGSPDARYAVVERRAGVWSCALLAVPYDVRPMAALAAQRGRPEWERALRTGYLR